MVSISGLSNGENPRGKTKGVASTNHCVLIVPRRLLAALAERNKQMVVVRAKPQPPSARPTRHAWGLCTHHCGLLRRANGSWCRSLTNSFCLSVDIHQKNLERKCSGGPGHQGRSNGHGRGKSLPQRRWHCDLVDPPEQRIPFPFENRDPVQLQLRNRWGD